MNISILGGGAFGITLALHLSKRYSVKVWEFFQERIEVLNKGNCPLIDMDLNDKISVSNNMRETLEGSDIIIVVVASEHVRSTIESAKDFIPEKAIIVLVSKGFDDSLELLSDVIKANVDNKQVMFYGPTIAKELARGVLTGVVLASEDNSNEKIKEIFHDDVLNCQLSNDIVGAQLGALKNVVGIWGGIIDGLKLGVNTKAYLMTAGVEEMKRLAVAMGGKAETVYGLSGLGDINVTCISKNSRNRTFGEKLGKDLTMDKALSEMDMVVEGIHTVKVAVKLAKKFNVKMPLAEELYKVLFENKDAKEALTEALK